MQKQKSILIVSYYFPPDAAVGGKRVSRFCQYLPEFNIQPIVLTIDEPSCDVIDSSFSGPCAGNVHRVRPRATPLSLYGALRKSRVRTGSNNSSGAHSTDIKDSVGFLRRNLLALLSIPDLHWGWYRPAIQEASRIVADTRIDAVFSSGPPWTTHAIGYRIARKYNLPWIADFRDGWGVDPWRPSVFPRWRERLNEKLEERWLSKATLLVCTTDRLREAMLQKYTILRESQSITVSNGFEPGLAYTYSSVETCEESKKLSFVHLGELYGGRSIDTFCKAFQVLISKGVLAREHTRVILAGGTDREIMEGALQAAPELFNAGIINFTPRMNWEDGQKLLLRSNILIIFQGDHPTAIPAKFFEYLATGKPIIAIVKGGALAQIVRETDSGVVASPTDVDDIASAVERVLARKPRTLREVELAGKQYSFRELTRRLSDRIHYSLELMNSNSKS